jgi:leucyl aminopeptidase (aminopeptidase T)
MKGAKKIVETCAGVKTKENVLVVTDFNKTQIAEVLAAVAYERGAETVIMVMEPRKAHGQEPPETVAAAMKAADLILVPTTFSLAHTKARMDACKAGARVINMPAFTENMLIHGGIEADFVKLKPIVERVQAQLSKAKMATLTTAAGTNIVFEIGREAYGRTGIARDHGVFTPFPDLEAFVSPMEGTARGVVVIDGSVLLPEIGLLKESITLTVKKGVVTEINGGNEAKKLEAILKSFEDENMYNLAELGIGLNPKSKLSGSFLEDEGSYGTAHVALGSNFTMGGKIKTKAHIDLVMRDPTIKLDNTLLVDKGELSEGMPS